MTEHSDSSPEKKRRTNRIRTGLEMAGVAIRAGMRTLDSIVSDEPIRVKPEWWKKRRQEAEELMASRQNERKVLIVVAAQHPLVDGEKPGEEFTARLDAGAKRARELTDLGIAVEIYVPGSRHMHNGVADKIALAAAGVAYLRAAELPAEVTLHGDDLNQYYKGEDGVYNGGDEAFVAASYFKDTPDFRSLELMCSPGQRERWELQALANGVIVESHTIVPASGDMYHTKGAADKTVFYTRHHDPTWQGPNSFLGNLTREQRKPKP